MKIALSVDSYFISTLTNPYGRNHDSEQCQCIHSFDLYYRNESGLISTPIQLLTTNILSKLQDSFVVILS